MASISRKWRVAILLGLALTLPLGLYALVGFVVAPYVDDHGVFSVRVRHRNRMADSRQVRSQTAMKRCRQCEEDYQKYKSKNRGHMHKLSLVDPADQLIRSALRLHRAPPHSIHNSIDGASTHSRQSDYKDTKQSANVPGLPSVTTADNQPERHQRKYSRNGQHAVGLVGPKYVR